MPRASLILAVEGSADVRRALGQIVEASKSAQSAMNAEERRGAAFRARSYAEEARIAAVAGARRVAVEKQVTDVKTRLSRQASAQATREMLAGVLQEQSFAGRRETIYRRLLGSYLETERAKTQGLARETERRVQNEQRADGRVRDARGRFLGGGRTGSGGIGNAAGNAVSFAGNVANQAAAAFGQLSDQVQAVRTTRAEQERSLNDAFLQAGAFGRGGGDTSELRALRERVYAFTNANKLDPEPIVAAIVNAQTRYSAVSGVSSGARQQNLEDILRSTLFARQMHGDVSQTAAFSSMLLQQGISGNANRELVQSMVAISQNGAVELGDALKQGLGPMLRYVNAQVGRLPSGTSEDQRRQVFRNSMAEFFAGQQVEASTGGTVRWAGNRFVSTDSALQSNHTQNLIGEKLYNRFRGERYGDQRAVLGQMFTRTNQGYQLNEQYRNVFRFTESMGQLFGSDTTAFTNLMGSHAGGVTSQALLKPDRDVIAALMGRDVSSGRPLYEQVQQLYRNAQLDPNAIATAQNATAEEVQTQLNDERNRNVQALADNTAALQISNELTKFRQSNPGVSTFVHALPGGEAIEQGGIALRQASNAVDRQIGAVNAQTAVDVVGGLQWRLIGAAIGQAINATGLTVKVDPVAARQATTEAVSQRNRQPPP